jgi:hypothetical protein
MRESLTSYRAASRSLGVAADRKLFRGRASSRFPCTIVFPAVEDLKDWLHEWYEPESFGHADSLVRRVAKASEQPEIAGKIVAVIPFRLQVLTNL